jgi:hypothetical protein
MFKFNGSFKGDFDLALLLSIVGVIIGAIALFK